jgi:hypothetical protein
MQKKIAIVAAVSLTSMSLAATGITLADAASRSTAHTLKFNSVQKSHKKLGKTAFGDSDNVAARAGPR